MNSSLARATLVFSAVVMTSACHKSGGPATAPAPQGSADRRATNALPSGVTPRMVALGDSLFHAKSCARCHGADAKGAQNGPDLTASKHMHVNGTYNDFVRLITSGVPKDSIQDKSHRFAMQPRGGNQNPLSDDEIRSVAAYVFTLSHK